MHDSMIRDVHESMIRDVHEGMIDVAREYDKCDQGYDRCGMRV